MIEAPKKAWYPEVQNNVQIRHPKFGVGKVLLRMGDGEITSKVIVKFKEEGERKLSLKYAKLIVDVIPEPVPALPGAPGAPPVEAAPKP